MKRFHYVPDTNDRRIIRRWHLASAGFYGSILLGLILYATFTARDEVNIASAKPVQPASAMSGVQD